MSPTVGQLSRFGRRLLVPSRRIAVPDVPGVVPESLRRKLGGRPTRSAAGDEVHPRRPDEERRGGMHVPVGGEALFATQWPDPVGRFAFERPEVWSVKGGDGDGGGGSGSSGAGPGVRPPGTDRGGPGESGSGGTAAAGGEAGTAALGPVLAVAEARIASRRSSNATRPHDGHRPKRRRGRRRTDPSPPDEATPMTERRYRFGPLERPAGRPGRCTRLDLAPWTGVRLRHAERRRRPRRADPRLRGGRLDHLAAGRQDARRVGPGGGALHAAATGRQLPLRRPGGGFPPR